MEMIVTLDPGNVDMGGTYSHGQHVMDNPREEFYRKWNLLKDRIDENNVKQVVRATAQEVREFLDNGEIKPWDAASEIVEFVGRDVESARASTRKECHRCLLLEALDICCSYEIPDRRLVRKILAKLFIHKRLIDREIIYCLFNRSEFVDEDLPTVTKKKREYILQQVSGWQVNDLLQDTSSTKYYLDLPLARPQNEEGDTQVLADALYRQRDPEYVLLLLRHGATTSSVYLWPVTMSIDLRLSIKEEISHPSTDAAIWNELRILNVYYRARGPFSLHVVMGEEKELPASVSYDDVLLVSPRVKECIPADRYKSAPSLQHLGRLAVRKALLLADNLPRGIRQLEIPKCLTEYLDLLSD